MFGGEGDCVKKPKRSVGTKEVVKANEFGLFWSGIG